MAAKKPKAKGKKPLSKQEKVRFGGKQAEPFGKKSADKKGKAPKKGKGK